VSGGPILAAPWNEKEQRSEIKGIPKERSQRSAHERKIMATQLKPSSLKEITEMQDDQVVFAVQATFDYVGPFYPAKPGDANSQSFQKVAFRQGDFKLKALFRNRDEVPKSAVGKPVIMTAYHNDKGWFGLKSKDNTYTAKKGTPEAHEVTERVLLVTQTATIVPGGYAAAPSSTATTQAGKMAPAPRSAPNSAPLAQSDPADREHVMRSRQYLARSANAYILAAHTAKHVKAEMEKEGVELDVQALATTFFLNISGSFQTRPELVSEMPVRSVVPIIASIKGGGSAPPPAPPPPPPEPEPEPNPPLPPAGPTEDDIPEDDIPF